MGIKFNLQDIIKLTESAIEDTNENIAFYEKYLPESKHPELSEEAIVKLSLERETLVTSLKVLTDQ